MKMKPIEIPKLLDHSSVLRELTKRRDGFGALLVKAEAERLEVGMIDPDKEESPQDPAMLRAAELLGEPIKKSVPRTERLIQLANDIRDLKAAVAMVDAQIRVEKSKTSATIRGQLQPEYNRRCRVVCEALIALHHANADLQAMTSAMEDQQIEWTGLGVMSSHAAGAADNTHSPIALDLRDSVRLGFIRANEIPEALRA